MERVSKLPWRELIKKEKLPWGDKDGNPIIYYPPSQAELDEVAAAKSKKDGDVGPQFLGDTVCFMDQVGFNYGIPLPDGTTFKDPRIGSAARHRDDVLENMHPAKLMGGRWANDRKVIESAQNKYLTWKTLLDNSEAREVELIGKTDLDRALKALDHFNRHNTMGRTFGLIKVYGSKDCCCGWAHCNFGAVSMDDNKFYLFFAELRRDKVTLCCIVDRYSDSRGCGMCGEEFVHPAQGGFRFGLSVGSGHSSHS